MITFQCSACQTIHQAKDDQAGIRFSCTECGLVMTVPAQSTIQAPVPVPAVVSEQPGWYYIKEKRKLGPVSLAELQQLVASGQLRASDMLLPRRETKWIAVENVPELYPVAKIVASSAQAVPVAVPVNEAMQVTAPIAVLADLAPRALPQERTGGAAITTPTRIPEALPVASLPADAGVLFQNMAVIDGDKKNKGQPRVPRWLLASGGAVLVVGLGICLVGVFRGNAPKAAGKNTTAPTPPTVVAAGARPIVENSSPKGKLADGLKDEQTPGKKEEPAHGTKEEPAPVDQTDGELLEKVSQRLLTVMDPLPSFVKKPTFEIVNEDKINAYAKAELEGKGSELKVIPKVVVYSGLMNRVIKGKEDAPGAEDRLAFILSHELGHVYLAHIVRRPPGETAFIQQVFTRDQESQADLKGMQMALKAGFSFQRGQGAIHRMKELGLNYSSFEGLGVDHPSWNDRLMLMDKDQATLWKSMSAFQNGTFFLLFEQYTAAERFLEVTKEFPQCYEAWNNLGYARLMQYCDDLNADDLRELDIGQVVVGGFFTRPQSLEPTVRSMEQRTWKGAVAALEQALKLKPDLVLAKANLGVAYLVAPQGKDVPKARQYLQEAVEQMPPDKHIPPLARASTLINAGVAVLAVGQHKESIALFAQGEDTARKFAGDLPRASATFALLRRLVLQSCSRAFGVSGRASPACGPGGIRALLEPGQSGIELATGGPGALCQAMQGPGRQAERESAARQPQAAQASPGDVREVDAGTHDCPERAPDRSHRSSGRGSQDTDRARHEACPRQLPRSRHRAAGRRPGSGHTVAGSERPCLADTGQRPGGRITDTPHWHVPGGTGSHPERHPLRVTTTRSSRCRVPILPSVGAGNTATRRQAR